MPLQRDPKRGQEVGEILYRAFTTPGQGIFGRTEMPEDVLPEGVTRGSLAHLLFVTLTVAIDYQRDAHELWAVSRTTYQDVATRYLFSPERVHATAPKTLEKDLKEHGLSRKEHRDAWIWRTVATTFLKKWGADPRRFLEDCKNDAPTILSRLSGDTHVERGRQQSDFPYLRGPKIGPLWVRMLRDNVGLTIRRLDAVPIPVDVHIARATFSLGVLRGECKARLAELIPAIQEVWRAAAERAGRIALDYDEPLWHLSKFGCSHRIGEGCPRRDECPVGRFCVRGVVRISPSAVGIKSRL